MPLFFFHSSLKGMITRSHTLNHLLNNKLPLTATIDQFIYKQFRKANTNVKLGRISRILEREPFVVITEYVEKILGTNCQKPIETVKGIVTKEIFLDYILRHSHDVKQSNGI